MTASRASFSHERDATVPAASPSSPSSGWRVALGTAKRWPSVPADSDAAVRHFSASDGSGATRLTYRHSFPLPTHHRRTLGITGRRRAKRDGNPTASKATLLGVGSCPCWTAVRKAPRSPVYAREEKPELPTNWCYIAGSTVLAALGHLANRSWLIELISEHAPTSERFRQWEISARVHRSAVRRGPDCGT